MMDTRVFRSFVKVAMELQADDNTPASYTMVKAAAEAKYGPLKKLAWNSGELAGLGILAAPSASSLAGKPWGEKAKDVSEVTGLGLLAAPYAHNMAAARSARYANSGIGQRLTRVFSH